MKTSSTWGPPPSRFYRLLGRLETLPVVDAEYDLVVVGCADGKFVLPAARRGLRVFAVDVDQVALFGGYKPGVGGEVHVPGLCKRLDIEGIGHRVTVSDADMLSMPQVSARLVLSSGAIQYSRNLPATAGELVDSIARHVTVGGLLYIDYMLPSEEKLVGRANCPDAAFWREWLEGRSDFRTLFNRVLPPVIDRAHVEVPYDHYHHWGHLLAERLTEPTL